MPRESTPQNRSSRDWRWAASSRDTSCSGIFHETCRCREPVPRRRSSLRGNARGSARNPLLRCRRGAASRQSASSLSTWRRSFRHMCVWRSHKEPRLQDSKEPARIGCRRSRRRPPYASSWALSTRGKPQSWRWCCLGNPW